MDLNIFELESYLNVTQNLIDSTLRGTNKNNDQEIVKANQRLQMLNGYKAKITKLIEEKLNENFS